MRRAQFLSSTSRTQILIGSFLMQFYFHIYYLFVGENDEKKNNSLTFPQDLMNFTGHCQLGISLVTQERWRARVVRFVP
jgi:hypothetical protein